MGANNSIFIHLTDVHIGQLWFEMIPHDTMRDHMRASKLQLGGKPDHLPTWLPNAAMLMLGIGLVLTGMLL